MVDAISGNVNDVTTIEDISHIGMSNISLNVRSMGSQLYNDVSISKQKDQIYKYSNGRRRMLGSRRKLARTVYNKYISLINIKHKAVDLDVKCRERHFYTTDKGDYYEM